MESKKNVNLMKGTPSSKTSDQDLQVPTGLVKKANVAKNTKAPSPSAPGQQQDQPPPSKQQLQKKRKVAKTIHVVTEEEHEALPPAPPPPPPPPQHAVTPAVKSLITPQALREAQNKLKKQKLRLNAVSLDRYELFDKFDFWNHIPLVSVKDVLNMQSMTADVTALNLSGVEQVTDMFMYLMLHCKINFPSLKQVSFIGCYNLTDQGIRWLTIAYSNLDSVDVKGCCQLTDRSLFQIIQSQKNLFSIDMSGTSVGIIPPSKFEKYLQKPVAVAATLQKPDSSSREWKYEAAWMSTSVSYKEELLGTRQIVQMQTLKTQICLPIMCWQIRVCAVCQEWSVERTTCTLISWCIMRWHIRIYVVCSWTRLIMSDKVGVSLNTRLSFKLVILQEDTFPWNTLAILTEGKDIQNNHHPLAVRTSWKAYKMHLWNMYGVNTSYNISELFLSYGSVVVLPYQLKTLEEPSEEMCAILANRILAVFTKHPETVFILLGITDEEATDWSEKITKVKTQVVAALRLKGFTRLKRYLTASIRHNWALAMMNFHDQEVVAAGERFYHIGKRMFDPPEDKSDAMVTLLCPQCIQIGKDQPVATDVVTDILRQSVESYYNSFRSLCSRYQEELRTSGKMMETAKFPLLPLETLIGGKHIPDEIVSTFSDTDTYQTMDKFMEIMSLWGKVLYYPHVKDRPGVRDFQQLETMLHKLMTTSAPKKAPIRCLGTDIPYWTKKDLEGIFTSESVDHYLKILKKHGVLLRFPRDPWTEHTGDTCFYILTNNLPDTPAVNLEHFWPADIPEDETQKELNFSLTPGIPESFFPNLLRHCLKLGGISVMWKKGVIVNKGLVTILVEHLADYNGTPIIYLSARVPGKVKDVENNPSYMCIWSTMKIYASIVEYLIQKHKLCGYKTVTCSTCVPTGNRYVIWGTKGVHHFMEHEIKKGFNCPVDKFKCLPKYLIGPILSLHDIVPAHRETKVKDKYSSFNRCLLCLNCSVEGAECPGNLVNKDSVWTCSCERQGLDCDYCRLCHRCISYLKKLEATVCPTFKQGQTVRDHIRTEGSLVGASGRDTLTLEEPMTPDLFNHLDLIFIRGSIIHIEVKFEEMGELVWYSSETGEVKVMDKEGKILHMENRQTKASEGDMISVILRHKGNDLRKTELVLRVNNGNIYARPTPTSTCTLSLTNINPMMYQIIRHGFQLAIKKKEGDVPEDEKNQMQEETVRGPDGDTFNKCVKTSSYAIEAWMLMYKPLLEELLFTVGGVDYSGAVTLNLPRKIDLQVCQFPSFQFLKKQLMDHSLCYTRTKVSEMQTIPATAAIPDTWHIYRMIHFVDAEGTPHPDTKLPDGSTPALRLMWAWHLLMATKDRIVLPRVTSNLLPDIPQTEEAVSKAVIGLKDLIRLQMWKLYLELNDNKDFQKNTTFEPSLFEEESLHLRSALKARLESSALHEVQSKFFETTILYLCEGHSACMKVEEGLTEVLPEIYGPYSHYLTSIDFPANNIVELKPEMFHVLPNLTSLDASNNYLEKLPSTIGLCKNLHNLTLADNNLSDLPDALADCQKLTRLEISTNVMDVIPPVVTKLHNLERLFCSHMMLTSLPENIGDLEKLEKLYVNGNCFTSLPKSFAKLKNLQDLGISGVPWVSMSSKKVLSFENFSRFLDSRRIMRWLEAHNEDQMMLFQYFDEDSNGTLDNEEVGKLNAAIFNLFPRFGYMGVEPPDNDTPSGFPEEILSCTNLEYLNLYYQGLVSVPAGIQNLTKLKCLNVGHNPYLLSIPAELGKIQTLQRLELEECPLLKTPPKEIRDKGFASTYAYLQRLLSGSTSCKRTKLMLVGLGGAGKTSLVRSLLSKDGKAQLTLGEEITDGIDISTWTVNKDGDQLTFNMWDFAGQTIYYNTHQFFLSNRAVYLLLWNVRLGYEHAGLDFWLNSISVHAPQAPIFVVGSHCDQVASLELPVEQLKERYRQIAGFHFISSLTGMGIKELQQQLVEVALQQQYMGEQIPEVWLKFENFIISRRSSENLIEFKEIEKLAGLSGIFDKGEVFRAVQFLHDLGTIQYFTNEYLKSKVVINPQWIVDVMACVVSVKDSPIKEGRLKHQDISKIWKDYPAELNSWLLRMTEEYDLTFPLESEKVNLVPCLLPEKQPKIEWPELDKNSEEKENKMIYQFDYLPAGLFNRGQVRLHQFSDSALIWKRGSYLKKNGHIALIQQFRDSELIVTVRGPRPENILFMVHEVFDGLISESFRGVTYDFMMPCLDCAKHNVKEPHMFAASTIRRALELKAPFLQCIKYFHNVSCVDLLTCMPPDSHNDFDLHIAHAVRGLKALRKDLTADIFLSYCDKDVGKDRNSMIHPARVYDDLKARGYKCYFPPSGLSKSMDDMARALFDASVFVAFMSANYGHDEACCNIFKYARLVLKKPMVVVAIGDGFDWKQSHLGILLTDEVYINMTKDKLPHYQSKFDELLTTIHEKTSRKNDLSQTAPCFFSYTWVNSKTAVDLGTRCIPSAVGWGDPRELKMYLEKNGIRCWIDVERVGQKGLFEDIAVGLLNARVAVVCISDEYADSSTCCSEFRYASKVLDLPIILAVVGTGSKWRASEIGVLSLNYPIVNFQEKIDTAHERLLHLVKEQLSSHMEQEASLKEKKNKINEEQKNLSFQELYELAQRKLLRQISLYAESQDIAPYPQLFVLDFLEENEKSDETEEKEVSSEKSDPPKLLHRMSSKALISRKSSQLRSWVRVKKFCVHILCEDEEGWHSCSEPVLLPDNFGTNYLEKFSPYLSRMSTVVMYNKQLVLNCMKQEEGVEFFKWLEETPQAAISNYQEIYCEFRQMVIDADTDKKMGGLARCHLPNGKTIWLCEKHRNRGRITVLSSEVVTAHHKADDGGTTNYMMVGLKTVDSQKFVQKFQSSKKSIKKVPVPETVENVRSSPEKKKSKSHKINKSDSQKKVIQIPSLKTPSSGLHKMVIQEGSEDDKPDGSPMDKPGILEKENVGSEKVHNKTVVEVKAPAWTKSNVKDDEMVQRENAEETKKEIVGTGTSSALASPSRPSATGSKTQHVMKEQIILSSKSSTPTDKMERSGAGMSQSFTAQSSRTATNQQFSSTTIGQETQQQLRLRKSERQKSKACVLS